MVTWDVLDATVRGSTHEHRGTPNQDAIATRVLADGEVVVAISDGHGGDRYFRSEVGSRMAVEIACDVLSEWWSRIAPGTGNPPSTERIEREVRNAVVPAITREWRSQVATHIAAHPFTDEERGRTTTPVDLQPVIAYGATLLVALASDRVLVLAQLGDGDIVLVRGRDVVLPIEPDARLVASQTTSLCLENADADFRSTIVRDLDSLDLVLLSTDGYANSFADDDWERSVGVDLAARVAQLGPDEIRLQLPAWLGESAAASGDDTSVALLVPSPAGVVVGPAAAAPTVNGLRRIALFSVTALGIGLLGGWIWGNASTDATPSRIRPPIPATTGTSVGGSPISARVTIVASPEVAVAFDPNPAQPDPTRTPAPNSAGVVTRLQVGDTAWEVTGDGGLTATNSSTNPVEVGIDVSAIVVAGSKLWAVNAAGTALAAIDLETRTAFEPVLVPGAGPTQTTTGG